jgi:DNA polymerase-3 subunit alpha
MNNNKSDLQLYFEYKCWQGFQNKNLSGNEYVERLQSEIDIIEELDFVGYLLIVADYIGWSKRNGIIVGCGRGSSGGSLACYCLGITNAVDPLKYGLLF